MKGELRIKTIDNGGATKLSESYFSAPFKLMNVSEDKQTGPLIMMIMNASPGVLENDKYNIEVLVSKNTSLVLKTQSFQRLFDMKSGASQVMNIQIEEDAFLSFIPHPVVPHKNSVFVSHNNFFLDKSSSLIWGEILTCGRKSNGEIFSFSSYQSISSIYLNSQLLLRENLYMHPASIDPNMLGQLEGFTHQASLIIHSKKINHAIVKNMIFDFLSSKENIRHGITEAPGKTILVRILGYEAEYLFMLLESIAKIISQMTGPENKVHVA